MISRLRQSLADVLARGNSSGGTNIIVNDSQAYSSIQATETPSGTTLTIDWDLGNSITVNLGSASGDVTLTLSNPAAGASYVVVVIQGSTARDIVWPAAVLWPAGITPIISTTDDDIDLFTFFYDGTNYLGAYNQAHA